MKSRTKTLLTAALLILAVLALSGSQVPDVGLGKKLDPGLSNELGGSNVNDVVNDNLLEDSHNFLGQPPSDPSNWETHVYIAGTHGLADPLGGYRASLLYETGTGVGSNRIDLNDQDVSSCAEFLTVSFYARYYGEEEVVIRMGGTQTVEPTSLNKQLKINWNEPAGTIASVVNTAGEYTGETSGSSGPYTDTDGNSGWYRAYMVLNNAERGITTDLDVGIMPWGQNAPDGDEGVYITGIQVECGALPGTMRWRGPDTYGPEYEDLDTPTGIGAMITRNPGEDTRQRHYVWWDATSTDYNMDITYTVEQSIDSGAWLVSGYGLTEPWHYAVVPFDSDAEYRVYANSNWDASDVSATASVVGGTGYLDIPYLSQTHALAIGHDPAYMVLGADISGAYATADAGATWLTWNAGLANKQGRQNVYVDDAVAVDSADGTFEGFFIAAEAGLYSMSTENGLAPWVDMTPLTATSNGDTTYVFNQHGGLANQYDTSIPFCALDWDESNAVYAAAGKYRWNTSLNGIAESYGSYPEEYNEDTAETNDTGALNFDVKRPFSIWAYRFNDPSPRLWPFAFYNASHGNPRDVSVAYVDGDTLVAVATDLAGPQVWTTLNGGHWIDLSGVTWSNVDNREFVPNWDRDSLQDDENAVDSVYLNDRGDLFALLRAKGDGWIVDDEPEPPDSTGTGASSGLYRLLSKKTPAYVDSTGVFEYIGSPTEGVWQPDDTANTFAEISAGEEGAARNAEWVHFTAIKGAGSDTFWMGTRDGTVGVATATLVHDADEEAVVWSFPLWYEDKYTWYSAQDSVIITDASPPWGLTLTTEPAIDPNNPSRVLIAPNGPILLTEDGGDDWASVVSDNKYASADSSTFSSRGTDMTCTESAIVLRSGQIFTSNTDVGVMESVDGVNWKRLFRDTETDCTGTDTTSNSYRKEWSYSTGHAAYVPRFSGAGHPASGHEGVVYVAGRINTDGYPSKIFLRYDSDDDGILDDSHRVEFDAPFSYQIRRDIVVDDRGPATAFYMEYIKWNDAKGICNEPDATGADSLGVMKIWWNGSSWQQRNAGLFASDDSDSTGRIGPGHIVRVADRIFIGMQERGTGVGYKGGVWYTDDLVPGTGETPTWVRALGDGVVGNDIRALGATDDSTLVALSRGHGGTFGTAYMCTESPTAVPIEPSDWVRVLNRGGGLQKFIVPDIDETELLYMDRAGFGNTYDGPWEAASKAFEGVAIIADPVEDDAFYFINHGFYNNLAEGTGLFHFDPGDPDSVLTHVNLGQASAPVAQSRGTMFIDTFHEPKRLIYGSQCTGYHWYNIPDPGDSLATREIPPTPGTVHVLDDGDGTATLNWVAVGGQADSYQVWRALEGEPLAKIEAGIEAVEFADNTVHSGVAYDWAIAAVTADSVVSSLSPRTTATIGYSPTNVLDYSNVYEGDSYSYWNVHTNYELTYCQADQDGSAKATLFTVTAESPTRYAKLALANEITDDVNSVYWNMSVVMKAGAQIPDESKIKLFVDYSYSGGTGDVQPSVDVQWDGAGVPTWVREVDIDGQYDITALSDGFYQITFWTNVDSLISEPDEGSTTAVLTEWEPLVLVSSAAGVIQYDAIIVSHIQVSAGPGVPAIDWNLPSDYACEVPPVPGSFVANADQANEGIILGWDETDLADEYYIGRGAADTTAVAISHYATVTATHPTIAEEYFDARATADSLYAYTVRAKNAAGLSARTDMLLRAWSEPSLGYPQELIAGAGDERISMVWKRPSDHATQSVLRYIMYAKTGDNQFALTDSVGFVTQRDPEDEVVDTAIVDLTNGTTYYVAARCLYDNGDGGVRGPYAVYSDPVTPIATGVPGIPGSFTATGNDDTYGISLEWTVPDEGPVSYNIYRDTSATDPVYGTTARHAVVSDAGGAVGSSLTYWDGDTAKSPPASGTTYHYWIVAVNANGASPVSQALAYDTASWTLPVPSAPSKWTVTPNDAAGAIDIAWVIPQHADTVSVWRGLEGQTTFQFGADVATANGNKYQDTGASEGVAYDYQLTALNTSGESAKTSRKSASWGTPGSEDVQIEGDDSGATYIDGDVVTINGQRFGADEGSNALELGDANTHAGSSILYTQTASSWTENLITFTVNAPTLGTHWLYVTDSVGRRSEGWQVEIVLPTDDPRVIGISGTMDDGETVTISGTNFGSTGGPPIFYTDFEEAEAVDGEEIGDGNTNAAVGTYHCESLGNNGVERWVEYTTDSLRSGSSMSGVSRYNGDIGKISVGAYIPGTSREVYTEAWVKYHPCTPNENEQVKLLRMYPTAGYPNWTASWSCADGGGGSRVSWETGSGYTECGNYDSVYQSFRPPNNTWSHMQVYTKHSSAPGAADGVIKIWRDGVLSYLLTDVISLPAGCPEGGMLYEVNWGEAYIDRPNGMCDNPNEIGCEAPIYWDNIYVASNQARVEIGSHQDYNQNAPQHREIQVITSWNGTTNEITFTVNKGTFSTDETAYIFVIDSGGRVDLGKEFVWE